MPNNNISRNSGVRQIAATDKMINRLVDILFGMAEEEIKIVEGR